MPVSAASTPVNRLTVDIGCGTYNMLTELLRKHNKQRLQAGRYNETGKRDPFVTKSDLFRGLIGTWIQDHRHELKGGRP